MGPLAGGGSTVNFEEVRIMKRFDACLINSSVVILQEDFIDSQKDDWRYIGIVIDRLFFWIFSIIILLGTLACLLNAPALYDTTIPVEQLVRDGLIGKKEED